MKEEIVTGIKNGLERKEPLDKIIQSFINAGYNQSDIDEAIKLFQDQAMRIVYPKENDLKISPTQSQIPLQPSVRPVQPLVQPTNQPLVQPSEQKKPAAVDDPNTFKDKFIQENAPVAPFSYDQPGQRMQPRMANMQKNNPSSSGGVSTVTTVLLLIVLVVLLGVLGASIFYKDKIISLIGNTVKGF